jgi:hypothetical protein
MSLEGEYRRFAASSLNSTEQATELSGKVGRSIMAEAWLVWLNRLLSWRIMTPMKPIC